jgi:hypothetical protein
MIVAGFIINAMHVLVNGSVLRFACCVRNQFCVWIASFVFLLPIASFGANVIESDVCVYGGTSGGVIGAVQAARLGKTAVVVEPGTHVGGLTSGGLGQTDTGNIGSIGGLSREFYRRVGEVYGRGESFQFEPHVAEQIFRDLLEESGVPVYHTQRLASVTMDGARIAEIAIENGTVFRAKMFIDATYEGDLLAMAGVSFTVGRESTNTYGESLNGIRPSTPAHQFAVPVDPYVVPGDPESGLLPFVQGGDGGTPGEGDDRVQAYNFRLCLTRVETNKMPIAPPANYDAADYELLGRYIQARVSAGHALSLGSFLNIATMPNGKTDMNNNGAFSTDFIGMNYTYPTNSHAGRALIWQQHEDYIRGFLTFLATDLRVPAAVRTDMQTWGLPRDEFQDSGGWPHALYVREARRMVSDYVMIQANCELTRLVTNSIGLASYNMDSHNCQRIVSPTGSAINEGDVQRPTAGPFGISYGAIVPRKAECENLFATFCLSASHIAFSSCRMEPVFMITSQSAATAAALAIDDDLAVQDVPYAKLRLQLLADRQILEWGASGPGGTNGLVIDNESPAGVTIVGSWTTSTGAPGYNGSNFIHDGNAGKGTKSVRFTPDLPETGNYDVYLRWTANANRANNTPVTLSYSGGATNYSLNQQANGGVWNLLGTFPFEAGTAGNLLIENTGTAGFVIADAAMWVAQSAPAAPVIEVVGSDSAAGEDDGNAARFTIVRSGDNSTALNVPYVLTGTATPGLDYPQPFGSIFLPAGHNVATLTIVPSADPLAEGDETIELTLLPGEDYSLGVFTNATAVLRDGGYGAWSTNHFTASELSDPEIGGMAADVDGDGIRNLLEFFHGSHPRQSNAAPRLRLVEDDNGWHIEWQRHRAAASLHLRFESSTDLIHWAPAPFAWRPPAIESEGEFETLRFPIAGALTNPAQVFYRAAVGVTPMSLTTNTARFFFSFDSQPDGLGTFAGTVTASEGFYGVPVVERFATAIDSADSGGASSFADFTGTNWLGSGSSTTPGHSLTFNPGSGGNAFDLTFSTIGLANVRLRMDVRSATQGGTPPTAFNSFTYDIGGGPVPITGANLNFPANNTFQPWTVDLSAIAVLENQPKVTLRWTFEDLAATPAESLRVDNIEVTADPVPVLP